MSRSRRFLSWSVPLCLAAVALLPAQSGKEIRGVVRDSQGPIAGAIVRVQTTTISIPTNGRGEFTLSNVPNSPALALTAWALNYYNGGPVTAKPGDSAVVIELSKHPPADDSSYSWLSAQSSAGDAFNCQNCHSVPSQPELTLPFDEWKADAHGTSATNRRFLSTYNGTDLSGKNQSPATRYFNHKDYGRVPLPPDLTQPYFGPGFRLDFPDTAGNCAACHLPAAAANAPYDTDPNTAHGSGLEGVACDLCHKTWNVQLQPATGLPYPNTPGVLSMEFRRPVKEQQLFLGPFDDVPGLDAYSGLQNQSRICAPCHFRAILGRAGLQLVRGMAGKCVLRPGQGPDLPGLPHAPPWRQTVCPYRTGRAPARSADHLQPLDAGSGRSETPPGHRWFRPLRKSGFTPSFFSIMRTTVRFTALSSATSTLK